MGFIGRYWRAPIRDRIVLYLRSAIFPAPAASRRAARATAPQLASPTETGSWAVCGASRARS